MVAATVFVEKIEKIMLNLFIVLEKTNLIYLN